MNGEWWSFVIILADVMMNNGNRSRVMVENRTVTVAATP